MTAISSSAQAGFSSRSLVDRAEVLDAEGAVVDEVAVAAVGRLVGSQQQYSPLQVLVADAPFGIV